MIFLNQIIAQEKGEKAGLLVGLEIPDLLPIWTILLPSDLKETRQRNSMKLNRLLLFSLNALRTLLLPNTPS